MKACQLLVESRTGVLGKGVLYVVKMLHAIVTIMSTPYLYYYVYMKYIRTHSKLLVKMMFDDSGSVSGVLKVLDFGDTLVSSFCNIL